MGLFFLAAHFQTHSSPFDQQLNPCPVLLCVSPGSRRGRLHGTGLFHDGMTHTSCGVCHSTAPSPSGWGSGVHEPEPVYCTPMRACMHTSPRSTTCIDCETRPRRERETESFSMLEPGSKRGRLRSLSHGDLEGHLVSTHGKQLCSRRAGPTRHTRAAPTQAAPRSSGAEWQMAKKEMAPHLFQF